MPIRSSVSACSRLRACNLFVLRILIINSLLTVIYVPQLCVNHSFQRFNAKDLPPGEGGPRRMQVTETAAILTGVEAL